ncbi:uncharacterized protein LOC131941448 [Physella acuta]|uniref:uncharacterized protein LOC131941448 n=1 Tax=Physella acuta TaxID=109671 RepID=UPI0027DBBB29|nr:uncharacterized protein LOC131941448 [Physella acuta]
MACDEDVSSYFKGTHEVQTCLEGQGEIGLAGYQNQCNKSHKGFVPVNNLTVQHFPPGYQDKELYDFTKAVADLTVRIVLKYTSPDRPEFVPGTKDPYPFYNTRGQNSLRTGTGRVYNVIKYEEGMDENLGPYRTCPCPECVTSATPRNVWWRVDVVTARHVVFDESEARQTRCRLWFDYNKCPVVNLCGWGLGGTESDGDWCSVYCWSHDSNLCDKLQLLLELFSFQWFGVSHKYKRQRQVGRLAIVVSHPHGCCKQVSVGRWIHRQVVVNDWTRYTYTTSTCPGSSGAMVYRLGFVSNHPHSGAGFRGLNYSGVCGDLD